MKPIFEAIAKDDSRKLRAILEKGGDVNERDGDGRTPLMFAVLQGNGDLVRVLLGAKAEVDIQDKMGMTALHFAAQDYREECAHELLKAKACVDIQDSFGNTPLGRAVMRSKGRGGMITLLLSEGADRDKENKSGISPSSLAKTIANFDVKQFFK